MQDPDELRKQGRNRPIQMATYASLVGILCEQPRQEKGDDADVELCKRFIQVRTVIDIDL